MQAQEIERHGQRFVTDWFAREGYATRLVAGADIVAVEVKSPTRSLLVQIKTRADPGTTARISSNEQVANLRLHAAALGCEPWEAHVLIDTSGNLVDIDWRKL